MLQDSNVLTDSFDIEIELLKKKQRLLREKGWIGITLNEDLWMSMKTYKRAFTFFKIIMYAIKQRKQTKQSES